MALARPLITICGTTGTGKSKLAIDIALRLADKTKGARIINADAMQVYSGMDIITNKVPPAEQCGIDHLLMGFKQPGEQYVVREWVNDAIRLIEETHRAGQIPIVVGGTTYWIQHLLFPNRLSSEGYSPAQQSPTLTRPSSSALDTKLQSLPHELLHLFRNLPEVPPSASDSPSSAMQLHSLLAHLDPSVAQRWHWRDTRKVLRNLCIIKEQSRLVSEVISEQAIQPETLRYPTLCFWLFCKKDRLDLRLDSRVDQMVQRGLVDEIRELRAKAGDLDMADYSLGIYQSIGYKEFRDYLALDVHSDELFHQALNAMKATTRRYAKSQVSWMRNKLVPTLTSAVSPDIGTCYLLDATELDAWTSKVHDPAMDIVNAFLEQRALPEPTLLSDVAQEMLRLDLKPVGPAATLEARKRVICEVCTVNREQPVVIESGDEWQAHSRTKHHRRRAFMQSPEGRLERERIEREIEKRLARQRENS
ncbi:tRNA isopentenyltransferase [Flagelloscypha sp. PMI_526]|nr:tRNA isopentenyltransferase [Flagelloscypha sp. PMI_526]